MPTKSKTAKRAKTVRTGKTAKTVKAGKTPKAAKTAKTAGTSRAAAKKTAAPKRQRRSGAAPACRLSPVPLSTDFQGSSGATITLVTKSLIGTVLIAALEYAGKSHVPAGQAVSSVALTVVNGKQTLKAVFVFDASTSGRGELCEDCGNGSAHLMRALAGDEPLQVLRIIGV